MEYNLITVAEFSQYAPEVNTTQFDSPTISGMISQASQRVSDYLQYCPILEIIVDEVKKGFVKTNGDLLIIPSKIPVVSVEEIKLLKGTQEISLTLQTGGNNKYNIDFRGRNIIYPYGEFDGSGSLYISDFISLKGSDFYIKLSYTAGWSVENLPNTIKQATILFMRDILSNNSNPLGATSVSQGSLSFSFGNSRYSSKLVNEAQRLLAPYKRVG